MEIKYLLAFGAALVLTLVVMPVLIPFLHKIKFGQSIRKEGPKSHMAKTGTPTMGGIVFVLVPILVMLILDYKAFATPEMLIVVFAYLGYAFIGFLDDFLIVVKKNNDGLKPSVKFLLQSVLAVVFYICYTYVADTSIEIPVLHLSLNIGILYFFLVFIMFTAESNAVNLTDGLDGLCAGTSLIAIAPFIIFSLLKGQHDLAMFLLAVSGALLGYLRFNLHPAKIFMGDTGSLAIGGLLAATAMVLKQELLLIIIGGVFLMEVLSVIIQVTSFKLTGKRVFRMSPLHHHFELGGMKETQVVLMFWCIALVFAALGLWLGVI
ncbi:phospho-N-acetylmuramoyl-pentapeptide-transferase [Amedibacterium intestinale]|uniref:Phospho-N-acetylmuramoyl-pentapeptide-transferase n=1 Tax=Amedibacterium intestinale TaxID=2583452 RepID=A0A6N4TEP5_9FIRM|nr:phospho-N-acetylmuramoyl-pentapeptide-transferase [Amedibacterium intestinale]RHO23988.1 phospho-N-acetylmuramoyl-pentapeptide-transferase [Eubacterium sp. AM18-26]RHO28111.1 phospho-N-acetylmuramoyl-pentapeptide-transferase [Eubacterium sp. AM18-10LB-B]RHO32627.1 phospho-N-acetylmuramoyl-pentapeptide-transferase [Erysipelotrichaceae bacterium AM17-60]BBK21209.1 phospho-N-acetylmuramoyl-pentapeptide-transferase [Amedibacterium intestinale]BBK61330.1 phospho-N-acetylmuramoyl-pentapeptide-tra